MLKISTPARSLVLLGIISCLLLFSLVSRYDLLDGQTARTHLQTRQFFPGLGGGGDDDGKSTSTSEITSAAPTSAAPLPSSTSLPPSTSSDPPSTTQSSASQTSQQSAPSSQPPSSAASSTPTDTTTQPPTQTSNSNSAPEPTAPPSQVTSESLSTGANGEVETVIVTATQTPSSTSDQPSQSADADQAGGGSKGVGTSTIVGLSVAGGIALICIAAFVIWKFTRKRFADDFDDNEAIKWPDLNAHGDNPHGLPTNRTGGTGFETNSEVNLTRPDSRAASVAPSAATSTVDLYIPGQDPYAVPPLPHLNPNQPYRDDPNTAFYDPYNGPIPQTLDNAGEAIPMTQIGARARSPGPQMSFDPVTGGRQSPGPQAAYGYGDASRVRSPGPGMALAGRASPGPQAAMGYGNGRHSPGPQVAYGS
ncbi:unnamed protein product [Somion occarium]|uniref:Uncharacterized protein n=1 Tax=Somion occarium TaxID=3059160 RepID=A0ABP1EDH4_9APHY